jgi:predicted TIM-barrel fold metal-dependent hydrolase
MASFNYVQMILKKERTVSQVYSLKIDAYAHIVPPKYMKVLEEIAPKECQTKITPFPALYDFDLRFRIMEKYGNLVQVLTLGWPPIEDIADPVKAVDLARRANDEMAELVLKYPDKFVAAIAVLPMNNIDAALKEADRTIQDLRFRGVYLHTPVNDKPLDSPEFIPLYQKMSGYNLPIFIHPMRPRGHADYKTLPFSKYVIYSTFGWPYETSAAMTHLVFSGIMEKYPNLKVVTHHCGGMVPYFANRIEEFYDIGEMIVNDKEVQEFHKSKSAVDYFKMFYADTALYGNPSALMCGFNFFGADHIIFGVDTPLGDNQLGYRNYRQTIQAIEEMSISDFDRKKIFEDNARRLMRLPT